MLGFFPSAPRRSKLVRCAKTTKNEISYARKSVETTVDAHGRIVTLYQVFEHGAVPEARTGVFPGVVRPESGHASRADDLRKLNTSTMRHSFAATPITAGSGAPLRTQAGPLSEVSVSLSVPRVSQC